MVKAVVVAVPVALFTMAQDDGPLQPVIRFEPLIIGLEPVPYSPKVIGVPEAPDEGTVSCSLHVSPALNKIVSPGLKLELLTLATVCQGVVLDVPLLESLPPEEST